MDAWEAFLSWLPDWHIWFDVTIPDAVREASVLLWSTFIPGLVDSIVLPLFWLALTATVFGWHDFSAGVAASRREALCCDAPDAHHDHVSASASRTPLRPARCGLVGTSSAAVPRTFFRRSRHFG